MKVHSISMILKYIEAVLIQRQMTRKASMKGERHITSEEALSNWGFVFHPFIGAKKYDGRRKMWRKDGCEKMVLRLIIV